MCFACVLRSILRLPMLTRSTPIPAALQYWFKYQDKCLCPTGLQMFCSVQSFEALNQRAVAVVVDPIQSVKGKVVIDAFRYGLSKTLEM